MLRGMSTVSESRTVPRAAPDALPELATYLAPLAEVFRRATSFATLERYVTGLLTDLPRKNADTIAAAVAGTSTERLQHLVTDATWEATELDRRRVAALIALSPRDGLLVLDDTGLPKQGRASAGVARQYSGTLGKIGNCQVVVTAEYVADEPRRSDPVHWPVSAQLFVPPRWIDDPERRTRAHIPPALTAQTKGEIALALIDRAQAWGVPFRMVIADAGYGEQPTFLLGLEARQLCYVCRVPSTFGVRRPEEVRLAAETVPAYAGRGQPPKPRPAPLYTAEAVLATLPDTAWQTISWRERDGEPLAKQFAAVRVHWGTGTPRHSTSHSRVRTGPEGWLLGERPLPEAAKRPGKPPEYKYSFSPLPAETSLHRLAEFAHSRWPIEQFYEDGKGECGLDDYQGRRWDGLHRHLALVMLAYSFLVTQRLRPAHPASPLDPPPSATPALAAFPPGGATAASLPAGRPSPDPGLALPRPGALAPGHRPDQAFPASPDLTE